MNPLTYFTHLFFSHSPKERTIQDELKAIRTRNKSAFHTLLNLELTKHLQLQEKLKDAFRDYDNPH